MKLPLTSNGITNESIKKTFVEMIGKSPKEALIAFIPTAVNTDPSEKGWFVDDLYNLKSTGVNIDIVDISALPKNNWLPRLEKSDVIFFSGGDTSHLMNWIHKSELVDEIPKLLEKRLYVGISAGSMAATPLISFSNETKRKMYEQEFNYASEKGVGLVSFLIRPHLNREDSPHSAYNFIEEKSKNFKQAIYAIDDNSAIKVDGNNIEIISEGEYYIFNQ